MNLLKTKSFELAIYDKGDINSPKIALLLPGRLDTKDYAHIRRHVEFLSARGFYALAFDPPGTWGSPGDIRIYTTQNYLLAINELIELLGNRPTVLMGHSRGGSMAMLAGIANPHVTHFIAVMSHFGPSAVSDKVKKAGVSVSYRDMPPGTSDSIDKKRFDLPVSYFNDKADYTGLESCTKPKLFFLGTKDVLVTPKDVKETYQKAAQPKKIYELDSTHDYRRNPAIIDEVNTVVDKFLNQYL